MAREDIIMLRQRELKRLHVIHKALEGTITQTEAAGLISLTERQIRRIVKRMREEGDEGIRHKSRGRPSHRKLPFKQRIVESTVPVIPTSVLPFLRRNYKNVKALPSAGRRCGPGSWKKENGRNTANGRPTGNGGRGRITMERCSRWTVPTTTGSRAEGQNVS